MKILLITIFIYIYHSTHDKTKLIPIKTVYNSDYTFIRCIQHTIKTRLQIYGLIDIGLNLF